jgi:hypothetical protein
VHIIGNVLAVLLLALVVFAGWVTWRRPFLGLGVLAAGMAFHNFMIMVLLRLGTNPVLIRVVQGWKEAIIGLLIIIAALRLYRAYREGRLGRPIALDWVAAAFLVIIVVYLVLPASVLHSTANFQQRLAAFRLAVYMPVLYALGRTFYRAAPRDIERMAWIAVGAAAIVGAFGLFELWFVPTKVWLSWGVNDFSAWLGFRYLGPGHLPENFFQTLPSGLYLRRMASTYLSPLGIAYTGLILFPIAVVLVDQQPRRTIRAFLASLAFLFLVVSIYFSITRLALAALVGEGILLALLMRRRWIVIMAPLLAVGVFFVLVMYPQIGPAVDADLLAGGPQRGSIVTTGDPSFAEHLRTLSADLKVAIRHPLGEGLGSAGTSANRFGQGQGPNPDYAPGESAILTMFVDIGVVGGVAYLVFYLLGVVQAGRAFLRTRGRWESALPMAASIGGLALLPITLTSDMWGDLSVLFVFWWAVGYSASLAADRTLPARSDSTQRQTVAPS